MKEFDLRFLTKLTDFEEKIESWKFAFSDEEQRKIDQIYLEAESIGEDRTFQLRIAPDSSLSWEGIPIAASTRQSAKNYLGQNMKHWRQVFHYSQRKVSQGLFCNQQTYSKYENGLLSVSEEVLSAALAFFHLPEEVMRQEPINQHIPEVEAYDMPVAFAVNEDWQYAYVNKVVMASRTQVQAIIDGRNPWYSAPGYVKLEDGRDALVVLEKGNEVLETCRLDGDGRQSLEERQRLMVLDPVEYRQLQRQEIADLYFYCDSNDYRWMEDVVSAVALDVSDVCKVEMQVAPPLKLCFEGIDFVEEIGQRFIKRSFVERNRGNSELADLFERELGLLPEDA